MTAPRAGAHNRAKRLRVPVLSFRFFGAPLGAAAFALVALGLGSAASAAPPPPAGSAAASAELDEHVAQGHRLYQLGQYQEAIAEFRRAYELKAEPRFLEQIAEAYRQLGGTEQALFYYDRYLAAAPDAPDRGAIEQRVAELESLRMAPSAGAPAAGAAPAPGLVTASPRAPRPIWRRWWFWTAVGVVLVTGVTVATLATRSQTGVPSSDLGDGKFY